MNGSDLFKEYERERAEIPDFTEDELRENFRLTVQVVTGFLGEINKKGFKSVGQYQAFQLSRKYDFSMVEKFLAKSHSTKEKLEFLYQIETDYNRDIKWISREAAKSDKVKSREAGGFVKVLHPAPDQQFLLDHVFEFGVTVRSEIEKYEKIHRLDKEAKEMSFHELQSGELRNARRERSTQELVRVMSMIEEPQRREKHNDLTLDRATLLIYYLLKYAKADCHNIAKAELISFLTGYSKNTVVQKLSRLHSKAEEKETAYKKDLQVVREHLANIGIDKLVEEIDKDLNF